MTKYDVAIIGAGPAGLYAYYYACLKGLKAILIEANKTIGGQPAILFPTKTIYDFPGFNKILAKQLIDKLINQVDKKNIIINCPINAIIKQKQCFKLNSTTCKKTFLTRYLILAIGAGFFEFNKIDGDRKSKNIHYFVTNIDTYKDKNVLIAGGGDSAVDWAYEILKNKITKHVTIIHRRDVFRATKNKIDTIKRLGCKFYVNKTTKVIANNKVLIKDNNTLQNQIINFDYLIVQYGLSYDLKTNNLLKMFKLNERNQINVDNNGTTNINGIYAIGNIAANGTKPRLIIVAVCDAVKAIENILLKLKIKYE